MTHNTTPSLNFHKLTVLGLVFFAVFMTALVSRTVFERLPHLEDEMAYLFQAQVFAGGSIVIDSPTPRRSFWMPFVLDYTLPGDDGSVRFGKYTPGWPALFAIGVALGQAWIVNALCAGLNVALVFRLGKELFDADVGLIAAALMAFSPMALLLNATMMSHTSSLTSVLLFVYAYWRMERAFSPTRLGRKASRQRVIGWAALAGVALGVVAISRPLTAVALALPFAVWSVSRLVRTFLEPQRHRGHRENRERVSFGLRFGAVMAALRPLTILVLLALLISMAIPFFSYMATGDPLRNLYTMVWSYDRLGFGEGYGRSGHVLQKAFNHARFDLSLMAADLFGWQITPFDINNGQLPQLGTITSEIREHLLTRASYFPNWGISWLLLPFGLLVGFRKRILPVLCWWCVSVIVLVRSVNGGEALLQNPQAAWLWIMGALAWINLPVMFWGNARARWMWLLMATPLTLIVMQMTYWIGSQLYSTRYFFEGVWALCILSALPLAWLARKWSRAVVYGALAVVMAYSLYSYSTPRIGALYGFNHITREVLVELNTLRTDDQPVLVLVTGPGAGENRVTWRALAALYTVSSPYFNTEIVVAWNYDDSVREQILAQFPDRRVIEMRGEGNSAVFLTDSAGG